MEIQDREQRRGRNAGLISSSLFRHAVAPIGTSQIPKLFIIVAKAFVLIHCHALVYFFRAAPCRNFTLVFVTFKLLHLFA